jgi:uncharacterized membrane protein YbhN (UPF0104 family)
VGEIIGIRPDADLGQKVWFLGISIAGLSATEKWDETMIISRVAILLALLSLLIAMYSGSSLLPALLRSGVVFLVAYVMMFVVQITIVSVYRRVREDEYREAREKEEAAEELENK